MDRKFVLLHLPLSLLLGFLVSCRTSSALHLSSGVEDVARTYAQDLEDRKGQREQWRGLGEEGMWDDLEIGEVQETLLEGAGGGEKENEQGGKGAGVEREGEWREAAWKSLGVLGYEGSWEEGGEKEGEEGGAIERGMEGVYARHDASIARLHALMRDEEAGKGNASVGVEALTNGVELEEPAEESHSQPGRMLKRGGWRRRRRVAHPVGAAVAEAWHHAIVARFFLRRTSCRATLTSAQLLIHSGRLSLEEKQRGDALRSWARSFQLLTICEDASEGRSSVAVKNLKMSRNLLRSVILYLSNILKRSKRRKSRGKCYGNKCSGRRRKEISGKYGNPIDDCWIGDNGWAKNRQKLARCARGYGRNAIGGLGGRTYVVTSNADNPLDPQPGTLRHAATRAEPLWIVFKRDMTFQLNIEILVYKRKTIDGRGARIIFQNGPCLAVEYTSNVIIHGISFHNCINRFSSVRLTTGPDRVDGRGYIDGYGVYIYASRYVWVDHCYFSFSSDTHVDVIHGSSMITISNNYFKNQNKVILLGHNDFFVADKGMRVTVMLNFFGPNCRQRLPRVRHGKVHVLNNYYPFGWGVYAIGGSAGPTFRSEGNYFRARDNPDLKEVTKHDIAAGVDDWHKWSWQSVGDVFANGAFFTESGGTWFRPNYTYTVVNPHKLKSITARSGPLKCWSATTC